jgi:PPOX class probable F420-dependent enzyme
MDATAMRRRIAGASVARLATADSRGRPHVVPVTFAVDGNTLYFAVDAKPKRTSNLKRLQNIAANPAVAVLFDHYEDDWSRLWWVRVDGTARVVDDPAAAARAIDLLVERYPQYRRARPAGPVVAISMERMSGWSPDWAAENQPACKPGT